MTMLLVCVAFAVVDGDDCYTCGEYDYGHDGDSVADDEDDSADADSVGISCSKTVVWCFCVLRFCVFAFLRFSVCVLPAVGFTCVCCLRAFLFAFNAFAFPRLGMCEYHHPDVCFHVLKT